MFIALVYSLFAEFMDVLFVVAVHAPE